MSRACRFRRCGALLTLLALLSPLGCATFRYERAPGPAAPAVQRTNLRLGVARFSQPDPAGFYPIWFSNTLADPIGDLSRAVAEELRRSGLFADVVYLDAPAPTAADRDYYRDIYQLDTILDGEVTSFSVTGVAELWSLIPPLIVVWPLHFLGLPTGPSHDSVGLRGSVTLQGLAPGAAAWHSPELRLAWDEHVWYSVLTIPANERRLQTRALDHFVAAIAAAVAGEVAAELPPR
jgi:hypothetical protein